MNPDEIQKKIKTMRKSHDEEMDYDCRKCGRKISVHNRDWHDFMCDECFDKENFPEEELENINEDILNDIIPETMKKEVFVFSIR